MQVGSKVKVERHGVRCLVKSRSAPNVFLYDQGCSYCQCRSKQAIKSKLLIGGSGRW